MIPGPAGEFKEVPGVPRVGGGDPCFVPFLNPPDLCSPRRRG